MTAMRLKGSRPGETFRTKAWAWFQRTRAVAAPAPIDPAEAEARAKSSAELVRKHLSGVLEAILFASDKPLTLAELCKAAKADKKSVKPILEELTAFYKDRGFRLDEIAMGYCFRTSAAYSPFVREHVAKKPIRMTRAQMETLAIIAYRQPLTRPEVDDVRGVDSGAVLKALLDRDLVRILGKRDEPGRPLIYGTTPTFLTFFGLRSLADLPTLREFAELTDESKLTFERELGEEAPAGVYDPGGLAGGEGGLEERTVPAPLDDAARLAFEEDGSLTAPAKEDEAEPAAPDDDEDDDEDDEDEDEDDDEDEEDDDDEDDDDEDDDDEDDAPEK